MIVAIVKFITTQTGPLLTEFSSIKSPPDITTDTMKNRHCKKGNPCGYFKQDTNIDSIDAQERPTEHGEEHTGNNESYSGNNLLRMKDISGLQVTENMLP